MGVPGYRKDSVEAKQLNFNGIGHYRGAGSVRGL
jgi:hypothetical protein